MKLKIASWNIAGCHPVASLEHLDYRQEDIEYFIAQLRLLDADIVCLQESHTSVDGYRINANDIANTLGYDYVFNSVASISHIEAGYKLSNAIISKIPFVNKRVTFFPNPSVPLFWSEGHPADTHEKNLQVVTFEKFSVGNNQMLPLSLFGLAYDDGAVGAALAEGINEIMAQEVSRPILWCGDFNWSDPQGIYRHIKSLNLKDSLPDKETRPSVDGVKKRPDHILYSPEFTLLSSDVIKVNTDHYLCWAEFNLP